jgi:DNA-binding transcriptional LysR family regulator
MPRSLRIGVSGAVARATTSDFLMPLLALPDCSPVIRTGDSVDHVRALRGAELDLVLCENEPPDAARRGLEVVMIAKTTLVAVTPPSVTVATDWQDVGLVHYRPTSSYRWEIDAYLAANKLIPRVVGEADDSIFLLEAAARGGYVAIVPRAIARERIARGELKVLAQFEPSQSGVFAMFQTGSSADLARRAVDILIEHVKAQID